MNALVEAARSYLGVPWRHLGRNPNRGLDCAGLIIRAAQDVGLLTGVSYDSYGRRPEGHKLTSIVASHAKRIPMSEMRVGDVLMFPGFERLPCHLAIVSSMNPRPAIIHSYAEYGRVIEHDLSGFARPTACYRING